MRHTHIIKPFFTFLSIIFLFGCSSLAPRYNHYALQRTTEIKVEAISVMEKAEEQYTQHEESVQKVKLDIKKMYEYSRARKNGADIALQWQDTGKTFDSFTSEWKERKTLPKIFITEASNEVVALEFDSIIRLEVGLSGKPKENGE